MEIRYDGASNENTKLFTIGGEKGTVALTLYFVNARDSRSAARRRRRRSGSGRPRDAIRCEIPAQLQDGRSESDGADSCRAKRVVGATPSSGIRCHPSANRSTVQASAL